MADDVNAELARLRMQMVELTGIAVQIFSVLVAMRPHIDAGKDQSVTAEVDELVSRIKDMFKSVNARDSQ